MENEERIGRFDQVTINTTRRVSYLSAPEGQQLNPNGMWMVAAAIGNELLLTKESIVIRIPIDDVKKVLDYHRTFTNILDSLGKFNNYESRKERPTEDPPGSDEED